MKARMGLSGGRLGGRAGEAMESEMRERATQREGETRMLLL